MTLKISAQTVVLMCLTSFATGAALSAVYDIFRSSRSTRSLKGVTESAICALEDLLFFTLAGCSAAIIFFVYSYGRIRPLALIAMAAGFWVYRKTISRPVLFILKRTDRGIRRLLRVILSMLTLPIAKIFMLILGWALRAYRKRKTERVISALLRSAKNGFEKGAI